MAIRDRIMVYVSPTKIVIQQVSLVLISKDKVGKKIGQPKKSPSCLKSDKAGEKRSQVRNLKNLAPF